MPPVPDPAVLPLHPPYAPAAATTTFDDATVEEATTPRGHDVAEARTWSGTRLGGFVRGKPGDPVWVRPALLALLLVTAILYTWGLSASGWANSFYSAAAQAGSKSWKAFFFGSSDAANSITVDKPPLALWPMALSVRLFGLSSWSVLLPEAAMGVATVGVLYAAVRRVASAGAALLAGLVLALTPVAALMFRFNNPDALLVLLMTAGAYAVVRAIESGRLRWVVTTGVLVGLGFLTKQLQVMLVVPAFAAAYLLAAPVPFARRVRDLLIAGGAMVAAAGWWIAIVELVPAQYRPYVGGTQHNSILELTLGYNGFGRITGNEVGSVGGGGGPGGGRWGATGITRLFDGEIGGQIAWLIPAALVLLVAGLWLTRRAPRTDAGRASLVLWGGWLVVTALVFSYMGGIFHAYYTVALGPAVGALVGIGGAMVWRHRHSWWARGLLAGLTLGSAFWAGSLLGRSPGWNTWIADLAVLVAILGAAGLLVGGVLGRRVLVGGAAASIVAVLLGPAAWSLQTVATPHSGAIVTAGPAVVGSGPGGGRFPGAANAPRGTNGQTGRGGFGGQGGAFPGGRANGQNGQNGGQPGAGGFPGAGGMGGLLDGSRPSGEVVALLEQNADRFTWVAATVGSNNASGYQLATQDPVMPIGGFNGSDPSPTLAEFQSYVAAGKIHYFIAGGGFGGRGGFGRADGGSSASSEITSWVESNFTATTVGGVTLYDLTQ